MLSRHQPRSRFNLFSSYSHPQFERQILPSRDWLKIIDTWINRRQQRRDLAQLDNRLLRDIGLSRLDAINEVSKPFWK